MPRQSGRQGSPGKLRAVLDTNVLVSGLISPSGPPGLLIAAWRRKEFELVVSPAILAELGEVLQRDKIRRYYERADRDAAEKYLAGLRRFATLVPGDADVRGACADPEDEKFLAAALEAGAAYLVSGDDHLLDLGQYRGIEIVRPAEFLVQLRRTPIRP